MIHFDQRFGYSIMLDEKTEAFLSSLEEEDYDELCEQIMKIGNIEEVDSDMISLGFADTAYEDTVDMNEGDKWIPPREIRNIQKKVFEVIESFKQQKGESKNDTVGAGI